MPSPPEIRPIIESQNTSPNDKFGRQPFEHHPNTPSIVGGAPPPNAALQAAEAAARERDDRPVPPKRLREWEDDASMNSQKKPANDESRVSLVFPSTRRASPPDRIPNSPFRSSSEVRRLDEQRRADDQRRATENYHPSEAAHHPPALGLQIKPQPSPRITSNEERLENATPAQPSTQPPAPAQPHLEPAARKMDMDEDYDDSGDEEKRPVNPQSGNSSPNASNAPNLDG
jgi:glucose repression mediator protein